MTSTPQVMGPPPVRLQPSLYPSQNNSGVRFPIAPAVSTTPLALAPAPVTEDRPQDAEQLQDALASAGVDLKAEEYNLAQISTPNTATAPQPAPFAFPPSYIQPQQSLDDGKLIFNRPMLSRFVDRIGLLLVNATVNL